ncbi:hypothetical protein DPMN_014772 [Dreissena polymorpha]|uniref:Uncharacterized protein n=1 Tax=Dreissena polymorpha TaxID=45954 RepID=A0A9D4S5J8_DREPO|nr:hypothetical protein DPMN_014772 [Dreissena polymorpha]
MKVKIRSRNSTPNNSRNTSPIKENRRKKEKKSDIEELYGNATHASSHSPTRMTRCWNAIYAETNIVLSVWAKQKTSTTVCLATTPTGSAKSV